ncbi:MAG TPA: ABA4-like family protein [Pseudonocardia sp.]
MSTGALFTVTFWLAAPFWAVMILLPRWSGTARIMASPWVTVLPLAVYLALAVPHAGEHWAAVSRPDLEVLRGYLGRDYGAALVWAQLISFDLFLGRWMYREAARCGIPSALVSPLLLITVVLSPVGLSAFLAVRSARGADRLPGRSGRDRSGAGAGSPLVR